MGFRRTGRAIEVVGPIDNVDGETFGRMGHPFTSLVTWGAVAIVTLERRTRKEHRMLPPFIIEQIRKREEEESRPREHVIELPLPAPVRGPRRDRKEDEADRGVVIIDLV
jgi:hypothetical protein